MILRLGINKIIRDGIGFVKLEINNTFMRLRQAECFIPLRAEGTPLPIQLAFFALRGNG